MSKIKKFLKPRLKLVRGTRLTSGLFIGASIAIAAGVLWAANMYYDIDTSTVMVGEKQEVTGTLTATTTVITVNTGNTTALTVTQRGIAAAVSVTSTASMTSDIFKITNLGSGKSFVVEDSDTDSTPFVVDASGNVGIGSSTPAYALTVAGHAVPSTDVTYNLGASGLRWANIYVATTTIGGTIIIDTDDIRAAAATAINITAGAGSVWKTLAGDLTITSEAGDLYATATDVRIISSTGNIYATSSADILLALGDSAGAREIMILDSNGAVVFRIDSDGNATTTGDLVVQGTGIHAFAGTLDPTNVTAFTLTGSITGNDQSITDLDSLTVNTISDPEDDELSITDGLLISGPATSTKFVITTNGLIVQAGGISLQYDNATISGTGKLTVSSGGSGDLVLDSASGYVSTSDRIFSRGGFETTSTDATIRKKGEEIVRGVVPIFGFDLPARCKTSCVPGTYVTITRVVENDDDIFPEPYSGTTRKYRFAIRYADATTTAASRTTWQIATSSNATYVSQFTLPPTGSADLTKGFATTTSNITLPTTDDWFLRVTLGGSGNYELQVYDVMLIGVDEVQ